MTAVVVVLSAKWIVTVDRVWPLENGRIVQQQQKGVIRKSKVTLNKKSKTVCVVWEMILKNFCLKTNSTVYFGHVQKKAQNFLHGALFFITVCKHY